MELNLTGKVALITGGSKGIGRQVALTFVKEGAKVAICARNQDTLEEAKKWIQDQVPGSEVFTVSADLQYEAEVQKVVSATLNHYGEIDILINNAGACPGYMLEDLNDEIWHKALAVKFLGYVRAMKAVMPHFKAKKKGVVVNVVGNDGLKYPYWELTGTAANAADLAVAQALANQYGRYNIRINSVNPGPVDTDRWNDLMEAFGRDHNMTPAEANAIFERSVAMGRIATAQEIADVTVFLASDRASYVHGTMINVDGNQQKSVIDQIVSPELYQLVR
ncbi:SDR family NAD(P)-dependent oxidoreductase [Paenibacillus sp. EPM92]|uniref:SDR family NAD(P)-dependent oxidoreductase n=1 Tax=Paenibacillus sp. EPM92 TaxID=1561195 RepID=UPI0019162C23|nr:SDR family NAD(P)-dependent oxidoreductase [Paenibacillus sp. EPM92]